MMHFHFLLAQNDINVIFTLYDRCCFRSFPQALNMHTRFETADQAIAFCERNGWAYSLQRPFTRVPGRVDNNYAYNMVPVAVQVRRLPFAS